MAETDIRLGLVDRCDSLTDGLKPCQNEAKYRMSDGSSVGYVCGVHVAYWMSVYLEVWWERTVVTRLVNDTDEYGK